MSNFSLLRFHKNFGIYEILVEQTMENNIKNIHAKRTELDGGVLIEKIYKRIGTT